MRRDERRDISPRRLSLMLGWTSRLRLVLLCGSIFNLRLKLLDLVLQPSVLHLISSNLFDDLFSKAGI